MKNIAIIGGVIVAIFVILFALQSYSKNEKLKDNPYDKEDLQGATIDLIGNPNYNNIITPTDLEKKLKKEDEVVVYFFSPTCVHCQAFTPKLMDIVNQYELDIPKYNLLEYVEGFQNYEITSTPTVVYFKDGKEVNRMVGNVEKQQAEMFFKDMGIIK